MCCNEKNPEINALKLVKFKSAAYCSCTDDRSSSLAMTSPAISGIPMAMQRLPV